MRPAHVFFLFFLFFLGFFSSIKTGECALAPEERQFYLKRDFTALNMAKLNEQDSRFVQFQQADLRSCRLVRDGDGDIKSVLVCFRFLAREKARGLGDKQSQDLFVEMDRLCSAGVMNVPSTQSVLEMEIPWSVVPKSLCLQEILRTARQQLRGLRRKNLIQAWGLYKRVLAELKPPLEWQREVKRWSGF